VTPKDFKLTAFGFLDGKCKDPSCGGDVRGRGILKNMKMINTECLPRFVQCVDLQCNKCNNFCTPYEQSYVDTLPIWRRKELAAAIAGKADIINMALIVYMRNNTTAAEVSGSARANLRRWYASKHEKWKASWEQLRIHNVKVVDEGVTV